jgi:hypothetical protein
MLDSGEWSWYPSRRNFTQMRAIHEFIDTEMETLTEDVETVTFKDSGRSVFLDFSAWIITKEYNTEASSQNEGKQCIYTLTYYSLHVCTDDSVLAHTFKPRTVKLHLCEYNPEYDRHPYLSFTQRLLRAAGAANLTEIWLDAVEAKRLGLSYESCTYFV